MRQKEKKNNSDQLVFLPEGLDLRKPAEHMSFYIYFGKGIGMGKRQRLVDGSFTAT